MVDPKSPAQIYLDRVAALEDEHTAEDDDTYLDRCYALAGLAARADPTSIDSWESVARYAVLQGMMTVGDETRSYFDEALTAADRLRDLGAMRDVWEPVLADVLVHAASKPWGKLWLDDVGASGRVADCATVLASFDCPRWRRVGEESSRAKMLRKARG